MADDQGPSMEVRAFIAVVLSLAVMLGYQYFFAPTQPAPGTGGFPEAPATELSPNTAPEQPSRDTPGEQPSDAPGEQAIHADHLIATPQEIFTEV